MNELNSIRIEFPGSDQINGVLLSVTVNGLNEVIRCARGNADALLALDRMIKEAGWLISNYSYELKSGVPVSREKPETPGRSSEEA